MSQSITILTSLITSARESIECSAISDSYFDDHYQRVTATALKLLTRPSGWTVKIKDQDGKRTRPTETLKVLEYIDTPMMGTLLYNLREDARETLNRTGFGHGVARAWVSDCPYLKGMAILNINIEILISPNELEESQVILNVTYDSEKID